MTATYPEELYPHCPCLRCNQPKEDEDGFIFPRMSLCPTCGNKRCPAAADHVLNICTGSNESGQPGSLYPASKLNDTRTMEERIADFWESVEEEEIED